ncbi:MAG: hypothetical protein P8N92_09265 [Burkholderiales bacterium]|nr:hypothetical protein [Burkholderiales bacterium]
MEKAWVKIQSLGQNKNKFNYVYIWTSVGRSEKSKLMADNLSKTLKRYRELQAEIVELEVELNQSNKVQQ